MNGRIRLLDIIRGLAVLGTLGTNIWLFAYLGDVNYIFTFNQESWWLSLETAVRTAVLFIVNGKFLGLLAIMFGAGLELKYQQALRKGKPWPGMYLWVSFILLMEGFIHFMLVMEYDILMGYAVVAMIVSFIVKGGERAIKRTMMIIGFFHGTIIILIFTVMFYISSTGGHLSLGNLDAVTSVYKHGTWLEQVVLRLNDFWLLRGEVIFVLPMNVFLFLSGVMLMRAGAFAPDETGRIIRKKLFRFGIWLGVPLNALLLVPGGLFDIPVRYLFAPLLSIGYLALTAMILERTEEIAAWRLIENTGKMALSCYVLQNLLSSIFFYGWGFGFGGELKAFEIVFVWFAISLIQLVFASLWLKKFKQGPLEALRKLLASLPAGGIGK